MVHYTVERVTAEKDIVADSLYFLRGREQAYLIRLRSGPPAADTLPIQHALTGQALRPIPTQKFLAMGKKQSLVRLVPKHPNQEGGYTSRSEAGRSATSENLTRAADSSEERAERILDIGAFSQLLDAAQRSGLVPSADVIAHVRDREFRKGNYQKASQDIQSLHTKFTLQASQREQRLRRESIEIASGKIKMSAKELQQKKARDIAETQRVERANKKFIRVIEGLRILQRSDQQ